MSAVTHAYAGIYFPSRHTLVAYAMCGYEDCRDERPWSVLPTCPKCAAALGQAAASEVTP